jgi:hypothetical protein
MGVAPVLSILGTGMSAMSSITGAQGQAKADEYQAQRSLEAAQYGRIKAAQTGEAITQNMTRALGHIAAVRASAGADIRSPSSAAVMGSQEGLWERKRAIEMGNVFAQTREDERAAQMYTDAASRSLLGGYLGAAGSLVGGIGGAYKSMGSPDLSFGFFGGDNANVAPTASATPTVAGLPRDPLTGRVAGPV